MFFDLPYFSPAA